ncbi:hypothetical protein [Balneicella halophila]|nr:hypothetical protein [Balneicella halophila]
MKTDNFIISLKTAKLLYVFSAIFFLISLRASKNDWESSDALLI